MTELVVGKKYRSQCEPRRYATVLYVGKMDVFYEVTYPNATVAANERSMSFSSFSNTYEEIPKWKPEVGKFAWHTARREYVEVLCIHGDYAFCLPSNNIPIVLSKDLLVETDPENT